MSIYKKIIIEATGCSEEDAKKIENCMRHTIFHSTLDWQTKDQLVEAAKQARTVLIEAGELPRPVTRKATPKATRKQIHAAVQSIQATDTDADADPSCPKASDGKHVPDPESISPRSNDEPVVDIHCKLCGCSGSVTIKPEDILW